MIWALCGVAAAGGFAVTQQGATASGTGHASTARYDLADQAWANPAALVDDGGLRVGAGVAMASSRISAETSAGAVQTVPGVALPPHLFASLSVKRFAVGVSLNTAYAGGVRWPDDSPLRFESISSAPQFIRVAPFLGVRVGPVQLAVGAHIDRGTLVVTRATDHVLEEGRATLALGGTGAGFHAAAWVPATPHVSLGLTYKSASAVPLEGLADFDVPDAFGADLPDQVVTSRMVLPDRVSAGVQVEVGRVRVLADLVYTRWSANQELAFHLTDPATDDVVQVNAWRDTLATHLGGELAAKRWVGRLGGYVDGWPNAAAPLTTLAPSSPDGTRVGLTVGGGVRVGPLRVDAFGEQLWILRRTSASSESVSATYRGTATLAGLTLGVQLGEPAHRPDRNPNR